MTEIQPFDFGGQAVRVVTIDGEPWFVARDVCGILGYAKPRDALARLEPEQRGSTALDTLGGQQQFVTVNEDGLNDLILDSHKASAKALRRWITRDVLPTIRKTGQYGIAPALTDEQIVAQALQITTRRVEELEAKVATDAPKVLFADAVATSHTDILVGDLAKILRGNGIDIGANRLFGWLRTDGYLIRRKGTDWNMPTQRSMDLELFRIKETAVTHSDGHVSVNKTPKVTGKGQAYFINRYTVKELAA